MPMDVLGAHEANTQGTPHKVTRKVAKRKECAIGARIMALNRRWPYIQAVRRSGLYLLAFVTTPAIAAGGRAVKFSSSGDLTKSGIMRAPTKVTREKSTSEKLPIRPISPRASLDCLKSCGA